MDKIVVIVLTDTSQPESLKCITNALTVVKESKETKADIQLVFTGPGIKWLGELTQPQHPLHEAFNSIKGNIRGVCCNFCASSYNVIDIVNSNNINILEEYGMDGSFTNLVDKGYRVMTF